MQINNLLQETTARRLDALRNRDVARFMTDRLDDEIKRLHNPDYQKTVELFRDYAGVDLTEHWQWNHFDQAAVEKRLGLYLKLRGDIVHRSRTIAPGTPEPHPVKKVDLEKAINFLKSLVEATERAFTGEGGGESKT